MNWKSEAIDRLKAYEYTGNALQSLRLQEQALLSELSSVAGSRLDAPTHRGPEAGEEYRLDRMVKLELIRRRIRQNELWKQATERGLSVLDQEERQVLRTFYMRPAKGAVEQLGLALGMERSAVYRLRDKALERFVLATFGIDQ